MHIEITMELHCFARTEAVEERKQGQRKCGMWAAREETQIWEREESEENRFAELSQWEWMHFTNDHNNRFIESVVFFFRCFLLLLYLRRSLVFHHCSNMQFEYNIVELQIVQLCLCIVLAAPAIKSIAVWSSWNNCFVLTGMDWKSVIKHRLSFFCCCSCHLSYSLEQCHGIVHAHFHIANCVIWLIYSKLQIWHICSVLWYLCFVFI